MSGRDGAKILGLDTGEPLQASAAQVIGQEIVNLVRLPHIGGTDHGQGIERNVVPLEEPRGPVGPIEERLAAPR